MSQIPILLSREYVTALKPKQCVSLLSLLAEASRSTRLPAVKSQESVLALEPRAMALKAQNIGKKISFLQTLAMDTQVKE